MEFGILFLIMRLRISKSSGLIFLILLVVIVLHYSGPLRPLEGFLVKFLEPFGTGIYHFSQKIQTFWRPEISTGDYLKIQEEKNQLIAKNVELRILERENSQLREALRFIREKQYDVAAADVIARDPTSPNYLILDKGEKDGIQNNLPVVSSSGILVGKIIKTEFRTSIMLVLTDTNFQTAGVVLNSSPHLPVELNIQQEGGEGYSGRWGDKSKRNTAGLVRGDRGLSIKMEFIPQDEAIDKDDIVITSGLELNMPRGLVIGKVSEVKKEAEGVFNEAILNPLISYDDLNIVMILLPRQ